MMKALKNSLVIALVGIILVFIASCSNNDNTADASSSVASDTNSDTSTTETSNSDSNETAGEVNWDTLPTNEVTLTDDGLDITDPGTYILSGSSSGQVTVNTDGNVRIVLNNANIKSELGAAIDSENAGLTVIELASDTTNSLEDAATRTDETIDGTIYATGDLTFTGDGSLDVKSNFADGIVSQANLLIAEGIINITSSDEGIVGTDSVSMSGGVVSIDAVDDGIKAVNETELGSGVLTISGGDLTVSSGDDAIKSEQKVWITGGKVTVETSVEGIEAPEIVLDGGDISIYATDDGINASASDLITDELSLTINGGNVTVEVAEGDTDCLDSNGDLTITGGEVTLIGQNTVDYDGTGTFSGGILNVNGETVDTLPEDMMGGVGGPAGGPMDGDPNKKE